MNPRKDSLNIESIETVNEYGTGIDLRKANKQYVSNDHFDIISKLDPELIYELLGLVYIF